MCGEAKLQTRPSSVPITDDSTAGDHHRVLLCDDDRGEVAETERTSMGWTLTMRNRAIQRTQLVRPPASDQAEMRIMLSSRKDQTDAKQYCKKDGEGCGSVKPIGAVQGRWE
jgi:hypothetical protein